MSLLNRASEAANSWITEREERGTKRIVMLAQLKKLALACPILHIIPKPSLHIFLAAQRELLAPQIKGGVREMGGAPLSIAIGCVAQ